MNERPGYKPCEIGFLPEDWPIELLGDKAIRVGSGLTPTGGSRVYKDHGRPFVRSQNVGWGTLLLGDLAYIDDATHATFPDTEIRVDDVLLNITGASIGRCAVADARLEGGNVNQHVCIIRVERGLRPRFLNFFLLSDPGQRQIDNFQAGGNRQGLNFSQVRSIRVPVPGESEQRAIEGALSDMDELLGGLDQLIAKKRNLKQAAMQQLLSGQIRLPGFTGKWEIKRLGDVSDCDPESLAGDTAPHFAFNYIALEDVDQGSLRSHSQQVFGSAPSRARRKLRNGDVLVSTVRPNLRSHLLFQGDEHTWVCSTGFCVVRCRAGISHPGYVFFQMFGDAVSKQINSLLSGSNYPAINSGDVRGLAIPCPEFAEQAAISMVLSDMDAEIAALEVRRDKTRALKQAMMQELLTGRTRLVQPAVKENHKTTAQKGAA